MANIGITLRSTRIQRGLTIEQVAQDTRISARFLEALENDQFDELPAPVYVRGFLRSYANYLHLDPEPLVSALPGDLSAGPATPASGPAVSPPPVATPPPHPPAVDPFRPLAPSGPTAASQHMARPPVPMPRGDPFSPRRPEPETPLDTPRTEHRGRVGGVLVERGAVYEGQSRGPQLVAIAGAAFVVVVVMALVALVLDSGDGGGRDSVLAGDGLTPEPTKPQTVIVTGSTTAAPTASETATTEVDATATPSTTEEAPATPTEAPTEEPTAVPTATPTPPPPTATPTATTVPPTPTATLPAAGHGSGFSECPTDSSGQPQCGVPMVVVCTGTGGWFVDYGNDFPKEQYGWYWTTVSSNSAAIQAGQAGCR